VATDNTLFNDDFIDKAARDIWQSARLHAQERKSGAALNPKAQTDRIRRELQGAATIIATALLDRQKPIQELTEKLGTVKGELKESKRAATELKKDLDLSAKELRHLKCEVTELKKKLTDEANLTKSEISRAGRDIKKESDK
jgi:chromosome segregation ATPase